MLAKLLILAVVLALGAGQNAGTIVLSRNGVRSNSYTSGIVEIYNDEEWSSICADDSFGQDEADVVCHQLGYESAESYSNTADMSGYGSASSIEYGDVSCSNSNYLVLFQCDVSTNTTCQNNAAVTVTCSSTSLSSSPYDGQVRLTDGAYTSEGLVEVYCNDEWGTVCDDDFEIIDADTVCNQLGYTSAALFNNAYQGTVDQPIWLRNVECTSLNTCLTSCTACSSTTETLCTHSQDISVQCQYNMTETSSGTTTETCDFTDFVEAINNLVGIIVGVVIAFLVLVAICIAIPFIICCCVGGLTCCACCAIASKA